ncbi:hypothetical protein [Novosphingobium rhizosphaerae]|uniref:hypothetical protein n=1 Tax=Novosphingobium rhizosphaerae TaxID=1551649 RepID=UPI0017CD3F4F
MARPGRRLILTLVMAGVLLPGPAGARDALGVWDDWAAFRDPAVPRCYAIAMPAPSSRPRDMVPYMTIGTWPRRNLQGQVHWRLSHRIAPGSKVTLSLGDARFDLVAGEAAAWAQDRRMDAAVVAKLRTATTLSVSGKGRDGRTFRDSYRLTGAASAMDAATLGCIGA